MVDTCESLEGTPFKDEEISPKESMYESNITSIQKSRQKGGDSGGKKHDEDNKAKESGLNKSMYNTKDTLLYKSSRRIVGNNCKAKFKSDFCINVDNLLFIWFTYQEIFHKDF